MNKPKNIKDLFRDYRVPVEDAEWQAIADSPQVKHYNTTRRIVKAVKYPVMIVVIAAALTTVFVLMRNFSSPSLPAKSPEKPASVEQPSSVSPVVEQSSTSAASSSATVEVPSVELPSSDAHGRVLPSSSAPVTILTTSPTHQNTSATESPVAKSNSMPAATTSARSSSVVADAPAIAVSPANPETVAENNDDLSFPVTPSDPSQTTTLQLFIPSAFTPNGDGLNDRFDIKANFNPLTFEMTIFTKDGQRVFNARDIEIGWDGQFRGQTAPQDIYIYVIKYTNPDGIIKTEKGQILLIK